LLCICALKVHKQGLITICGLQVPCLLCNLLPTYNIVFSFGRVGIIVFNSTSIDSPLDSPLLTPNNPFEYSSIVYDNPLIPFFLSPLNLIPLLHFTLVDKKKVIVIGLKSFDQRTTIALYFHSMPCIGKKLITTPCKPPEKK